MKSRLAVCCNENYVLSFEFLVVDALLELQAFVRQLSDSCRYNFDVLHVGYLEAKL